MNQDQERAFNFVVSLRDFYGHYHAKKEREAYVVAVLYLGATAAFVTHDPGPPDKSLLVAGIIAGTLLAVALVAFQLYHRWLAARIVAACTTVASRWLTALPADYHVAPLRGVEIDLPAAVVSLFNESKACPPLLALVGIPALLFLWGVAVVVWGICR